MSHFNPNQHFDVENWRDQKIAQRTKDALAARDAAFAEKHAGTPLRELALYLARCARTLRHSPAPCEVDGGAFIEQRFGSWDAAVRAACLPPTRTKAKLNSTARYRGSGRYRSRCFWRSARKRSGRSRSRRTCGRASWPTRRP